MQLRYLRCNKANLFLAVSWCFGLLVGTLSAASASNTLIPMMRGAVSCPVSIFGLLLAVYLPFLLSALAAWFYPSLIYGLCAFKAFCFSYCAYGINLTFGNSAWLIRFLFLFSEGLLLPVLYLFWMRHISAGRTKLISELVLCALIATVVVIVDILWISPYLIRLFD